ncbi:LysR family transcriptional regulator [Chelativorans xinjiangense]|uniref:LysR family transcriptional regulator n=1 Tax=Chelativorans xinjiangense TaxID=2681485 RepID=UPI00135C88D6|nr:LysR family transcriptional regulator [Chelativorans xinjiangense]
MIDFRLLECFYWTARLNSFSRTAERLHTTQPAISQRVAALEAELGGKLIERGGRNFSLTARGLVLLDYCERLLDLRAEMLTAVTVSRAMRGTVRLGVSESIVRLWLNQFLERAHALYPNLVIDLTVDISPLMRDQLLRSELDLCLCLGLSDDARIINLPLFTAPLAFIASSKLDFGSEPLGIDSLRQIPIITYPKATSPYPMLQRALRRAGEAPPRIYTNSSLASMVQMAQDHIGICAIPQAVVQNQLDSGELRVVDTVLDLPEHRFTACHLHRPPGGVVEQLALLAQRVCTALQAPQGE